MFDIHSLMAELSKIRPIFHSEADFQFALAWQIHDMMPDSQIRLEFNFKPLHQEGVYLDIWIPSQQVAVELKYKTKPLLALDNCEVFLLKEQAAQNHGRYDFIKDVERVESARRGFAIILTNEPSYWKEDSVRKGSNHYNFRIHEGRELSGELKWARSEDRAAKVGDRQNPINLSGSYNLQWKDYSETPPLPEIHLTRQGKRRQFRYLAVAVGESPRTSSPQKRASCVVDVSHGTGDAGHDRAAVQRVVIGERDFGAVGLLYIDCAAARIGNP